MGHSIHSVREDAFNYAWDNSIEPALEIEAGAEVEFHVRDASDEQIRADSDVGAVESLDFSRVNPVSGPVFVKGASPGDVLAVEIARIPAFDVGLDGDHPGLRPARGGVPGALASHLARRAGAGPRRVLEGRLPSLPAFPRNDRRRAAGAGRPLDRAAFALRREPRHQAPRARTTLFLPVGVDGALFSVGDTHAAQGDGEVCGTAIETSMDIVLRLDVRQRHAHRRAAAPRAGPAARVRDRRYHVCTGVSPDLMEASRRRGSRHDPAPASSATGSTAPEAYAFASVAVDLRIHEVVDAPNWVVGAWLPEDLLERRAS